MHHHLRRGLLHRNPRLFPGGRRLLSNASPLSSAPQQGLLERYDGLIKQGVLQEDVQQKNVVEALDNLLQQMVPFNRNMELYHAQLKEWEIKRSKLREQLLQEEGQREARRLIEKKRAEQQRNPIMKWFSRWYKELQQKFISAESEKEMQWQLHAYGPEATDILRKKRRSREAGAGRTASHIIREKKLDQLVGPRPSIPLSPKGLYIYGNVGCGKTMLMDMFFNATEGVVKQRKRLHFHAALLEVHDWMHRLWKKELDKQTTQEDTSFDYDESSESESQAMERAAQKWINSENKFQKEISRSNLFELVADNLLADNKTANTTGGANLLCFDEMQVVDVFTAVALAGIFSALIKKGTIIISTSNRAPDDLNKEGMQKEIFDKFVSELQDHCHLVPVDSNKDYRRLLAAENNDKNSYRNYFWPVNMETEALVEQKWQELVSKGGGKVVSTTIPVMFARTLDIPRSCNGVARFSFDEICDRPVGAADYISLARNFHTVIITGIPMMSMRNRDKARRFITLVDELYNHRRQMICTAATSIDELFLGSDDGHLLDLEGLQFETEAEGSRSRKDVTLSGNVSPLGSTQAELSRIQFLFSGREELFAFQRAVSRLIEMQSAVYLQAVDTQVLANHPNGG